MINFFILHLLVIATTAEQNSYLLATPHKPSSFRGTKVRRNNNAPKLTQMKRNLQGKKGDDGKKGTSEPKNKGQSVPKGQTVTNDNDEFLSSIWANLDELVTSPESEVKKESEPKNKGQSAPKGQTATKENDESLSSIWADLEEFVTSSEPEVNGCTGKGCTSSPSISHHPSASSVPSMAPSISHQPSI
eukprot:5482900-Ditylum_brightwellii.AAC.1